MAKKKTNGNGEKIKMHERLSRVETHVETILENHLPHLKEDVEKGFKDVKGKLNWVIVTFLGMLISLIFLLADKVL